MMNFYPGLDLPVPDPVQSYSLVAFIWLLMGVWLAWMMRES